MSATAASQITVNIVFKTSRSDIVLSVTQPRVDTTGLGTNGKAITVIMGSPEPTTRVDRPGEGLRHSQFDWMRKFEPQATFSNVDPAEAVVVNAPLPTRFVRPNDVLKANNARNPSALAGHIDAVSEMEMERAVDAEGDSSIVSETDMEDMEAEQDWNTTPTRQRLF
ncbi:hypothetical protein CALCODRAFT_482715 [Calocera cornea HHB12733]|uniref:Uncharacterized protein n=1 Tax=Calocera cornea HHB12733 TaxID=1353952 RepID=A0A165GFT6_9BASI|nr:hypothetical protein CALCODRAFT_482715 [Calocera cornea HHB12733]